MQSDKEPTSQLQTRKTSSTSLPLLRIPSPTDAVAVLMAKPSTTSVRRRTQSMVSVARSVMPRATTRNPAQTDETSQLVG